MRLGLFAIALLACAGCGQTVASSKPSDAERYTPTRGEWIAVEINARSGAALNRANASACARASGNQIEVTLYHPPAMSADELAAGKTLLQTICDDLVKQYGWTDSVTVGVVTQRFDRQMPR